MAITKEVVFEVVVKVDDEGEMDESTFRDAIMEGLSYANKEGYLTKLDDETTVVRSYGATHKETRNV